VNLISKTNQHSNRSGFIERSLTDVNQVLEQSLFADLIARQPGLLQSFDVRLKLVSLLFLLVLVNYTQNLTVIGIFYLLTLILAARSHISLRYFILRIWVAVLIFTGLVALPGLFITPGPQLISLFGIVSISKTGSLSAVYLLSRAITSISLTSLLVLTTRWNELLKAFGVLRVPDVIVLILGMTYRYIHLFLHSTVEMFLSRKSRILRRLSHQEERQIIAATSGSLLSKSLQLSSDVYLAMQSRGFRYYPKTMDTFKFSKNDIFASFLVLVFCIAVLLFGR
jgi:cobalt ECF transporter T component CbiQ